MRLQQIEKERLRLKQQELLRQRPQVRNLSKFKKIFKGLSESAVVLLMVEQLVAKRSRGQYF